MPEYTPELRAEVDAAMAAATEGEWGVWAEPCAHPSSAQQELVQQVEQTEGFVGALYLIDAGGKCPATTGCGPTSAANAAAIVALHNAYPALTAHIDAQAATIAGIEARIAAECDRLWRIAIWNEHKRRGTSDEGAMREVNEYADALAALKDTAQ